ncbi:hypothetical protein ACEQ8H_004834 [Pleosporales sp. CAS-2024a]
MPFRAFLCRLLFCAIFSVSLINVFTKATPPAAPLRQSHDADMAVSDDFICPESALAADVLVVLRTGATESQQKLPVHLRTTLRCVPHFVVVSDMDEEIDGVHVHDVLARVSDKTKNEHDDFKLYRHLQEHRRQGLPDLPVMTGMSGSSKGDYLRTENDGWKLDKWKFLPMLEHAYAHKPDAKWFLLLESDTYLSWANLLTYLAKFDASKPYYIGKHLYINDIEFAYGGAGIVLSNPAMHAAIAQRSAHDDKYESFTATHWVGDCALGKVFEDIHIPLHRAFPHFQADSPFSLDPAITKIDRDLWCFPAITYHHVSPAEIAQLWTFEQQWASARGTTLRHRDVFTWLIKHRLPLSSPSSSSPPPRDNWDNLSSLSSPTDFTAYDHSTSSNPLERNAWKSAAHCRALCEHRASCLQFSFDVGSCRVSDKFSLGYERRGERVRSGWMLDRIEDSWRALEDRCSVRDWWAPDGEGENAQSDELKKKRNTRKKRQPS